MTPAMSMLSFRALFDHVEGGAVITGDVRVLLIDTADKHCTRKQQTALRHYLDGHGVVEIAKLMGVGHSTVHRHLFGDGRVGHGGGALAKIRSALVTTIEPATLENAPNITDTLLEQLEEKNMPKSPSFTEIASVWFVNLPPSRAHLFGPLAVLLVAHGLVDARRCIRVDDLALVLPRNIINAALSPLRSTGYIATDGVSITIRKTPLDEMASSNGNTERKFQR